MNIDTLIRSIRTAVQDNTKTEMLKAFLPRLQLDVSNHQVLQNRPQGKAFTWDDVPSILKQYSSDKEKLAAIDVMKQHLPKGRSIDMLPMLRQFVDDQQRLNFIEREKNTFKMGSLNDMPLILQTFINDQPRLEASIKIVNMFTEQQQQQPKQTTSQPNGGVAFVPVSDVLQTNTVEPEPTIIYAGVQIKDLHIGDSMIVPGGMLYRKGKREFCFEHDGDGKIESFETIYTTLSSGETLVIQ